MQIYESMRRERLSTIREETFRQQEEFHLPDGEQQRIRDMLLAMSFQEKQGNNHLWLAPSSDLRL